jgi:hypothetical protein
MTQVYPLSRKGRPFGSVSALAIMRQLSSFNGQTSELPNLTATAAKSPSF